MQNATIGEAHCPPRTMGGECNRFPCPLPCVVSEWADPHDHSSSSSTSSSQIKSVGPAIVPPLSVGQKVQAHLMRRGTYEKVWYGVTVTSRTVVGGRTRSYSVRYSDGQVERDVSMHDIRVMRSGVLHQYAPLPVTTVGQTEGKNAALRVMSQCTACDKTCGTGSRICRRSILQPPKFGGTLCPSLYKAIKCATQPCKVDCVVAKWGPWGACTKTCGLGHSTRSRAILDRPLHGGKGCPPVTQTKECNAAMCAIDCVVGPWGECALCSKTCGVGAQACEREVQVQAMYGGKVCPQLKAKISCAPDPCPHDCRTSVWGAWSQCETSCGIERGGKQTRVRKVVQRATSVPALVSDQSDSGAGEPTTTLPALTGKPCGALVETRRECGKIPCPVDCQVSPWGVLPWGKCGTCSKSCGIGQKYCSRSVISPAKYGGVGCPALMDTQACNIQPCPEDCRVGGWGNYSSCSLTCGTGGVQWRYRSPLSPVLHGGKPCPSLSQQRQCNFYACPIDCQVGEWGKWGVCSRTCGGGQQTKA